MYYKCSHVPNLIRGPAHQAKRLHSVRRNQARRWGAAQSQSNAVVSVTYTTISSQPTCCSLPSQRLLTGSATPNTWEMLPSKSTWRNVPRPGSLMRARQFDEGSLDLWVRLSTGLLEEIAEQARWRRRQLCQLVCKMGLSPSGCYVPPLRVALLDHSITVPWVL